ncbi:TPA: hypothetical protein G8O00_000920 [Salmonella enterica]|uniref:Uncharacterized protein n=1 Tax=Salmonella enterica TaxID=28901 RepID=A0A747SQ16_SALER|nr:hypothetical protein [Salmonella enterica]HAF4697564.1 hypothetical protein [Salmonella enterica]
MFKPEAHSSPLFTGEQPRPPSPLTGDKRVRDVENLKREAITFARFTQKRCNVVVITIRSLHDLRTLHNKKRCKFVFNLNGQFNVMVVDDNPSFNRINKIFAFSHTVMCNRDDGRVMSAGYIEVINTGAELAVSLFAVSGHYRPEMRHLFPVRLFLSALGVRKDKITLYKWG